MNPDPSRDKLIEQAHRRSAAHGLSREGASHGGMRVPAELLVLIERNRALCAHALPLMEMLLAQIATPRHAVVLSDANGVILHALGELDLLPASGGPALTPGAAWSEADRGANAIGTAIATQAPTQVHADEHYLRANSFLSSAAAPVFDSHGQLAGVLGIVCDRRDGHSHTLALAHMAARMLEEQMFALACCGANTLHFHSRPELLGTVFEGRAAFSPGGRMLAANRAGLEQLGLARPALLAHTLGSLLGLSLPALVEHRGRGAPGPLGACLPDGRRLHVRAVLQPACADLSQGDAGGAAPSPPRPPAPAALRGGGLRALDTGDCQVALLIERVRKVLGRSIPILVMGETGTGKELLAQAIHQDSPRAAGPFVAVNCAAIPEALIESELFGYEDGAFTGARKKGGVGRILQAHGGTLFLDEIGDMPLNLQARLLRVLQERTVTPLGSSRSIPVDVEVICATNRKLRDMIAAGTFREDLYYRLNGLVVKLPPLRERSDLSAVVQRILAGAPGALPYTLSDEAMQLFRQHDWPGNFRQLDNLLRTGMVLADADREIGLQHMPADFLDGVVPAPAAAPADAAVAPPVCAADPASLEAAALATILQSLARHGGNVSATAKSLGISRNTIYRKTNGPFAPAGGGFQAACAEESMA